MRKLSLLLLALIATTLFAQSKPEPSGIKLGSLDVSGTIRLRAEAWDWFDAPTANDTYVFGASTLRLSIGQKRRWADWAVEIEQPTLLGLPAHAIAPAPQGQLGLGATYFADNTEVNDTSVFLKQGFVRLKGLGGESNSLKLGRFEFLDGMETTPQGKTLASLKSERISQRLIGNFGFSHVGRSFDGGIYTMSGTQGNLTFLAARATQGVFNLNGMPEIDVDLAYGAWTRSTSRSNKGEFRVFGLGYHDGRTAVLKIDNRSVAARKFDGNNIRIATIGANLVQIFPTAGSSGTWDVLFWGAGQFGSWGVLSHRAWAYAAEGGYQRKIRHFDPWLRAGYSMSSGDSNSSDGTHQTFFQNLPTPRVYARFPFYNLMNNQDLFAEFIARPHSRLSLRFDVHDLHLSSSNDLWYSGGGAYESNTFGYSGRPSGKSRHLATVFDAGGTVQVNKQNVLGAYFARAQGGDVLAKIYPRSKDSNYGYLEWTFKF